MDEKRNLEIPANFIELPNFIKEKNEYLLRFDHLALLVFSYAPDRMDRIIQSANVQNSSLYSLSNKVVSLLNKEFFNNIYLERGERERVEGYIPTGRLTMVHGLPGVGKTVVLMKIRDNINSLENSKCSYFDFKSVGKDYYRSTRNNFIYNFEEAVYHYLKHQYIDQVEEKIKDWIHYKINYDYSYSSVKEYLLDIHQRPLSDFEWLKYFEEKRVRKKILKIEAKPKLHTLLKFLNSQFDLVLIFDNVDLFSIEEQRQIMDDCLHLSNGSNVPIVISLRTPNLRRLSETSVNSDFVYLEKFREVGGKEEKYAEFQVSELTRSNDNDEVRDSTIRATIRELISLRLSFIKKNLSLIEFDGYLQELQNARGAKFIKDSYVAKFWEIFDVVCDTFVQSDILQYCNYNIRKILILYYSFINKLLLNPDPFYSLNDLVSYDKSIDITQMRNYLYKWLLCFDEFFPSEEKALNIFFMGDDNISMLPIKILSYLYNHQNNNEMKYEDMAKDFWRFGVDRAIFRKAIDMLSQYGEFEYIWLDRKDGDSKKISSITMMPAGRYFLNILSTSREYAFWMSLLTKMTKEERGKIFGEEPIEYGYTFEDEYKLTVVYNFLKHITIPRLKNELDRNENSLYAPEWRGSATGLFLKSFGVSGRLYQSRVIDSVIQTIKYANIDDETRRTIKDKYESLQVQVAAIESMAKAE